MKEIKLGSLAPTRDFNYVKDTVNGFIEIAQCQNTIGEEINIASGKEITIGQLAEELIRQINPKAQIRCDEERLRPQNSEVMRLLGSNKKITTLTKWQPLYSFEEGLKETIQWMESHLNNYKSDRYNI
jgi:dTDP-glucose 4,6-dehydratase